MTPQHELTDAEEAERRAISERAIAALNKWDTPIKFEFSITTTIGLIGQLQLAFRHPGSTGPTRKHLEEFTRSLIEKMDPSKGDVYKFLCMGFDERYDE